MRRRSDERGCGRDTTLNILLAQLTDTVTQLTDTLYDYNCLTAGDLVHRARRTRPQRQSVFRVLPVVRVRSHDRRDNVELP